MDVERLVSEHHAPVYRYAYRLTGSAACPEHEVQKTLDTTVQ